jgi:glucosamine--fructose-6-phosphate aminotransferase (isomerizing)
MHTMCGIVGSVSTRDIVPILLQGLKRLEYRGYDSCGVAVHQDGGLKRARSTSRVAELEANVAADGIAAGTGIAHTRWATHGAPAVHNAHPHFSATAPDADDAEQAWAHCTGAQRHHREPRRTARRTAKKGYVFSSQTDTEVIAHLIDSSSMTAICLMRSRRALAQLHGAYAWP